MSKHVEYEVQWRDNTSEGWDRFATRGSLKEAKRVLADELKQFPKDKGEKFRFVKVTRTETREVLK